MSSNKIIALFEVPENDLNVKIFDNKHSKILKKIKQLIIDKEEIIPSEYYIFAKKGIHSMQIILDSKLDSLQNLFSDCFYLKEIDLSNLISSNIASMEGLFQRCISLTYVDFGNIDTSNVLDMQKMFLGCCQIKELDL